jgi:mRNA interferase RelE/StbE
VSGGRALRFTRTAEKELRRLDPPIRARVLGALDRLSADDRSLDVRRLTGSEHFRLRVGDWRVIYLCCARRRQECVEHRRWHWLL